MNMQNQIPKNWQKVKLGEVVEFVDGDRGSNYPKNDELLRSGYCLFLNTKNVPGIGFYFSNSDNQFITKEIDERLRKGKLKRGDFILTTRGTVGNFAYYSTDIPYESIRINSGMVILRNKSTNLNTNYFKQFLSSNDFKSQVQSLLSGSAQPQLPIRDLSQLKLALPPLSNQQQIASILSSFDDKIEVNNKIAKTLEEMAQTLFKEWFVKNALPTWEVSRFENYARLEYGKALQEEKRISGKVLVFGSSGQVGTHNEKLCSGPGIVVGRKGNVGSVFWIDDDFYPIDTTFYVNSRRNLYYVYFVLKNMRFHTGDSAVPGLNRESVHSFEILIPDERTLNNFEDIVSSMFKKLAEVKNENQKLAALRDLLLPKLMKGEVRV